MAWSVRQSVSVNASGTPQATGAPSSSTLAGSSIFLLGFGYQVDGSTPAGSDSASNSYAVVGTSSLPAAPNIGVFMLAAHNTASVSNSGGSFTVDLGSPSSALNWGFIMLECPTGAGAGSTDVTATAAGAGSSATPTTGTTGATAGTNEIAIAIGVIKGDTSSGANSPWTTQTSLTVAVGTTHGYADYRILTPASGTYSYAGETAANGTQQATNAIMAIFKAAAAASPQTKGTYIRQAVNRSASY